jgi:hypothetical protein
MEQKSSVEKFSGSNAGTLLPIQACSDQNELIIDHLSNYLNRVSDLAEKRLHVASDTIQSMGGSTLWSFFWYSSRGFDIGFRRFKEKLIRELPELAALSMNAGCFFGTLYDWIKLYRFNEKYLRLEYDDICVDALHRCKKQIQSTLQKKSIKRLGSLTDKVSLSDFFKIE